MGQLRGGSVLAAVDTSCSAPLADPGSWELVASAQLCLLSSLPQSSEPSPAPHPQPPSFHADVGVWESMGLFF